MATNSGERVGINYDYQQSKTLLISDNPPMLEIAATKLAC
jgi:hypothetical protein